MACGRILRGPEALFLRDFFISFIKILAESQGDLCCRKFFLFSIRFILVIWRTGRDILWDIDVEEPILIELIHSSAIQRLKEINQYGVLISPPTGKNIPVTIILLAYLPS